jgi:transcriptional regulator with GAF, ATPase, and Fis domain
LEIAVVADDTPAALPGRYEELIGSLAGLARVLAEDDSIEETLQGILTLSVRLVPGCTAASITVLGPGEHPQTIAATDGATEELDRRQYLLQDGPCLDAARQQQVNHWSLIEAQQRWPEFTSLAKELELRSYLAAGLGHGGQPLGALNLSSRGQDGFDRLDEKLIAMFVPAASAAIVSAQRHWQARDLAAQLNQALISRALIDHAIGILMAESRCAADQAFAVLKRASNNRRMKLRDLAAEIVTRVGGAPSSDYAGET